MGRVQIRIDYLFASSSRFEQSALTTLFRGISFAPNPTRYTREDWLLKLGRRANSMNWFG